MLKIIHTTPMGSVMNERDVRDFLSNSIMNMQLATVDRKGEPAIQPVWYYFEQNVEKLYACTDRRTQKVKNISRKNTVYFSIDEDVFPYRCVKGRGIVRVSQDRGWNVTAVEKLMTKYLGSSGHRWAQRILEGVRNGESVVLEITPTYFSTWDFSNSE